MSCISGAQSGVNSSVTACLRFSSSLSADHSAALTGARATARARAIVGSVRHVAVSLVQAASRFRNRLVGFAGRENDNARAYWERWCLVLGLLVASASEAPQELKWFEQCAGSRCLWATKKTARVRRLTAFLEFQTPGQLPPSASLLFTTLLPRQRVKVK